MDPFFTRRIPHTEQLSQDSWYGRISQGKNLPELDGRFFVLSTSSSVMLSGNASGTNGYRQVFRFSRDGGGAMATAHISRQPGQEKELALGNCDSPSISEDGKVVVFSTSAPLNGADTNAKLDVYARILTSDLGNGQTVLLSARRDALGNIVAIGNDHSNLACVSGSGRFVAFSSSASNLIATDGNGTYSDVFVVELIFDGVGIFMRAVTPEIVSINNSGGQSQSYSFTGFFTVGRNLAVPRSISHDGCRVAFYGRPCDWSGDLCPARDDSVYGDECPGMCTSTVPEQVYVRDRGTCGGPPKTFLVSRASRLSGGGIFNLVAAKGGQSLGGSISADGSTIAFSSFGTNLRATGTDADGFEDVFLIAFANLEAVSINPQRASIPHTNSLADIDGSSFNPMLSNEGLRVAFASHATKIVPSDTNGKRDAFVRVLSGTPVSVRFSVDANLAEANGDSGNPDLTGDGRVVLYESSATNLIGGDTNGKKDIFETFSPQGNFIRGDANNDGLINFDDSDFILQFLFGGLLPPACLDAADTNDHLDGDEGINHEDACILSHFVADCCTYEDPPAPFPGCGPDLTGDRLTCAEPSCQLACPASCTGCNYGCP